MVREVCGPRIGCCCPEAGAAKVCDDLAEGESKLAELEVAQKKLRAL